MGALDRLANFNAERGFVSKYETQNVGVSTAVNEAEESTISSAQSQKKTVSDFFNIATPLGYLMNSLHNLGYKVIDTFYYPEEVVGEPNRDEMLTYNEYVALTDEQKAKYKSDEFLTEFANVLLADGDVLTVSCAGSGKTSLLIFKLIKDIVTGEVLKQVTVPSGQTINVVDSVFVGTFLRSGAEELKQRLEEWQRRLGYVVTADRIHFGTLHAEFKRVLNEMGVSTPIGSPEALKGYLTDAIKSLGIVRKDGAYMSYDDYAAIEGILAYYRNRLDSERYNHPACCEYTLTQVILDKLYSLYQYYKQLNGVMDFEDLQELLYKYLYITPNKNIQDFIANRYRYIYLDEFQDTSQIQYAILRYYARGRLSINKKPSPLVSNEEKLSWVGLYTGEIGLGKIVCIGDDDQAIYSWRGSDVTIITDSFVKDFSPLITKLSVNYRCPSEILKPVIPSIKRNKNRYDKILRSANSGGVFVAREFANLVTMSGYLLDQIDSDMAKGYSVAIICRTNFDGMIPALLLEDSHKYKFSISSEGMTLSSSFARAAMEATALFTDSYSKAVEKTLTSLAIYSERYKVKELMNSIRNDAGNNVKTSIWTMPEQDIKYSLPSLYNLIKTLKSYLFDASGKRVDGGDVLALKYLFIHLMLKVYNKDNAYCQKMKGYFSVLVQMLEQGSYANVREFISDIKDINERLHARIRVNKVPIRIVSVHEFKGKEADSVYVWNDSDGVFPTNKTDLTVLAQVEEERRVHYIACTRAKKKCSVLTLPEHGYFYDELDLSGNQASAVGGVIMKSFKESQSNSSPNEINNVLSGLSDKPVKAELPKL